MPGFICYFRAGGVGETGFGKRRTAMTDTGIGPGFNPGCLIPFKYFSAVMGSSLYSHAHCICKPHLQWPGTGVLITTSPMDLRLNGPGGLEAALKLNLHPAHIQTAGHLRKLHKGNSHGPFRPLNSLLIPHTGAMPIPWTRPPSV